MNGISALSFFSFVVETVNPSIEKLESSNKAPPEVRRYDPENKNSPDLPVRDHVYNAPNKRLKTSRMNVKK